jgi:hypothetical protein
MRFHLTAASAKAFGYLPMLRPQVFAGPIAVFLVFLLAPAEALAQAHTKGRQAAPLH